MNKQKKGSTCLITKDIDQFWSKRSKCIHCSKLDYLDNIDQEKSRKLIYYYRITLIEYEELLVKQNGRCKICPNTPKTAGTLVVDHSHSCCPGRRSCGKCIRGLLCSACNTAIGLLEDDVSRMAQAIIYINEFEKE